MTFVVDANIIFSAVLNTNSNNGDLLINSRQVFDFIAPDFLRFEIEAKRAKLLKISGYSPDQLREVKYQVYKNLVFISEEQVSSFSWKRAYELVKDIDEKDTPYIAYAEHFQCELWTGDNRLMTGLKEKGYNKFISTSQLLKVKDAKMNR